MHSQVEAVRYVEVLKDGAIGVNRCPEIRNAKSTVVRQQLETKDRGIFGDLSLSSAKFRTRR